MKKSPVYNHAYYLLADTSDFGFTKAGSETVTEDGDIQFGYDCRLYRLRLEELLNKVAVNLKADYLPFGKRRFEGAFVQIFAESKRLEIGLDSSGARLSIFVRAKNYESCGRLLPCKITAQVTKGFRHLLGLYPNLWSFPSSAFTAFNVGWITDRGIPVSQRSGGKGVSV